MALLGMTNHRLEMALLGMTNRRRSGALGRQTAVSPKALRGPLPALQNAVG
jgi:hypothetical protein